MVSCFRISPRLGSVVMVLALLVGGSGALPWSDPTDDIKNWKEILPANEFARLVSESTKLAQEYTRSTTSLSQNAKRLQNEAYMLIMLAEAARRSGEGATPEQAVALQAAAVGLVEAAKKKDLDQAKQQVAAIIDFKKSGTGTPISSLTEAVPVHNLMEIVQNCYKKHQEYGRLSTAVFGQRGKPEEVATAAYKMAVLSTAITAHVPTDKDELKDKTPADWHGPTEDMRKATLEIALAAKAKNHRDVKAAIRRMDSACTKCHDNFRIDAE